VWYPIRGREGTLPASLRWFGDFDDPDTFVILGESRSQGGTFSFWGAATPLTATFTTLEWGATVSGTLNVGVAAGLANVPLLYELWVDNTRISSQSVSAGTANVSWDTRTVANGPHDLTFAVRHPTSGQALTSMTLPITVNNATAPPPPPPASAVKAFITQPASNASVTGTTWVVLWAEGTSGSANVYTLSVDGVQINSTNAGGSRGPVSIPWNTGSVAKGTHTLKATVRDASGKVGTMSITVTVR
jgi:thermitase